MNLNNSSFTQLGPEQILHAVEALGFKATGRVLPLGSVENRVFEVEIDLGKNSPEVTSPSEHFRVIKFYRPLRWTGEQILEEHQFLLDLQNEEIPVIAPIAHEGKTLFSWEQTGTNIWYALFPKKGGRIPEEMSDEQLEITGRLLGRLHAVGKLKEVKSRITLGPETYGRASLNFLLEGEFIPKNFRASFKSTVLAICDQIDPLFERVALQRIHGDFHLGNILWGSYGPLVLDFDDMVKGPCVQDIWPVVPGRDQESLRRRQILLSSYEQMNDFDYTSLRLIEPLRTLRMIYFSAWIARRWEDDSFRRLFHNFGREDYWGEQLSLLKDQLNIIA